MTIRFDKYEALSNDFVVVEGAASQCDWSACAKRVCDRRRGVGADGLLRIACVGERVEMDVWNSDGSDGGMCGNGLRCVALHAFTRWGIDGEIRIVVSGRERIARVELASVPRGTTTIGARAMVAVAMGDAQIRAREDGSFVDVGNPHLVLFVEQLPDDDTIARDGARIERAHSPVGVNVQWAMRTDDATLDVRTWERGSGMTHACGTGACAVAAAWWARGNDAPDVRVRLLGGDLWISCGEQVAGVVRGLLMRGEARHVFSGDLPEQP